MKANATHHINYNHSQKNSIEPSTMEIPHYLDITILSNTF